MRRAALAVLLTICVPLLLFGQRGGREGGSGSGSSGSGGYSGASSGGYSGGNSGAGSGSSGSYQSSSSSSSGSSSSSSSSSSGSGSNSGSSHSSSSAGSGGSSGSSAGGSSHSNSGEPTYPHSGAGRSGNQPGAGGSAGPHTTTGRDIPRSNMRSGYSDSSGSSSRGASFAAGTGSQLYPGNTRGNWLQQPVQVQLQQELPRADLDNARQQGKITAALAKLGLEPSKEAYQQKMAYLQSAGKLSYEKPQNRLSKFFFGDREKHRPPRPETQASLRRCVLKECGPTPPPCTGKNCRPAPPCQGVNCTHPPPAPDAGCAYLLSGTPRGSSYCQPFGYIDHCDGNGQCYARLGRVSGSYCGAILRRLKQEKKHAERLLKTQQSACSAGPQNADCSPATVDYQAADALVQELAAQYQMCQTAAAYTSLVSDWP